MIKFTDAEVENDKSLRDSAMEILRSYTGDYYFLVKMKRRLENGLSLSAAQLRGVLNCFEYQEEQEIENPPKEDRIEIMPARTPAKIHASYVNARQSYVYHKIDQDGYYLWLATGPQLVVIPKCQVKSVRNPILLSAANASKIKVINGVEGQLVMCKRCAKL
jgi:hypothetical protein